MYGVSIGQLEEAIYVLGKHFGLDFNGLTNKECVEVLRIICPQLHSEEELNNFGKDLIHKIEDKYGFKGLRIWYRINMQYAFFGHDMLSTKYWKLLDNISEFIKDYREEKELILKLDVFLMSIYLKNNYKQEYGVFNPEQLMDLYSILRTIHLSNYNKQIIESTIYLIEEELWKQGDNYYINKDLSNKKILHELYIHIGEEIGDDVVYEGHKLFYEYDGYGQSYLCI